MSDETSDAYWAVRSTVGLHDAGHVGCLRVSGEAAFDALDGECAADLYLNDGRMRHTLMLSEDATPFADVYVCRDDEDFFVLVEGPPVRAVAQRLVGRAARLGRPIHVEDLRESHVVWQVDGPFAWELVGELVQAEVANLSYASFMHTEDGVCFRAGKTGEYGYILLVAASRAQATWAFLKEAGARFGLVETGIDTLDLCALENGFFSMRHARPEGATPVELQQQWRVSYRKEFTGAVALARRLEEGPARRSTAVSSAVETRRGDLVRSGKRVIGEVYAAGFSPGRRCWVASAQIDTPYAHPGVTQYVVDAGTGAAPIRTHSLPLLHNRSLSVDPRIHVFAHRAEIPLPPLVPGGVR